MMQPITLKSLPFTLHILIEVPAALTFLLYPSLTLVRPQPYAHAVIRQYGFLLLSSNIIASVFAFQIHDRELLDVQIMQIEAWVAGSLALYHLAPLMRATSRMWLEGGKQKGFVGQPWVHALAHGICLIALMGRSLHWW